LKNYEKSLVLIDSVLKSFEDTMKKKWSTWSHFI
jgi:hypothetical protein